MNITFFAHKHDLDKINSQLSLGSKMEDYQIEVYNEISKVSVIHRRSMLQVTVAYSDFLKLQPILEFKYPKVSVNEAV